MFSPAVWTFAQLKNGSSDWWSKSWVRAMCRVQRSASRSGHVAAVSGLRPWALRAALVSVSTFASQAFDRGFTWAARAAWVVEAWSAPAEAWAAATGRARAAQSRAGTSVGVRMGAYPAMPA